MSIEDLLDDAVARGVAPGLVGIVADREGIRCQVMAGQRELDGDQPLEDRSVFRIASMTKAMASVGALQLVERGELSLDQPVGEILPELADVQVLEGFDGETPRLRPPATPITLTHLLTHTSGFAYWFSNPDLIRWYELTGTPDPLSGRQASIVTPLVHDPGERWTYGVSTDWVGQIVERVSGRSLEEQLRAELWEPLGMSDTTFYPDAEQRSRMVQLVDRDGESGLKASWLHPPDPDFASGGGGGHSTPRDYARFLRALLRGGELDDERVLKPETVELMFRDHLAGAPLPEMMPTTDPRLTLEVPTLPLRQGWGLGLRLLLEGIPGMRHPGSGDWAGLFNTYFWLDRATGIAGLFMSQLLPFFDPQIVQTLLAFEAAVYAGVAGPPPA